MKVAFTASGTGLDDRFDTRFGRTANFIVYDLDCDSWECHSNAQNFEVVQGAGIQAAQNILRLGAAVLVTGNVGPKAFKVLNAAGVKVYTASAQTVKEALGAYNEGRLSPLTAANVEGH